ncbi:hypothetical protein T4C_6211 [Trichinella pseudospiralis]|uniref:Uncharacterized protein n=1 Tax=Trichinella pseudospiralis TaxID=6337 RepID=A0A0V1JYW8_TRIPS|nr:hypothetical protein T4C_6211 [Trichinella pseudospiralis]
MDSSPNEVIWSLDFITDDDSDRRATLKTDIMIGERYRSAVSNLINVELLENSKSLRNSDALFTATLYKPTVLLTKDLVLNAVLLGSNCSNCKHGNLSYHTVYSYHEKQRISSSSIHDMLIGTTKASYS